VKDEVRKNNTSVRRKLFRAGIGFFILVMLVTSFFGKKGYMDIYRTRKSCRALEVEFLRLEEQKKMLELEIRELETNPRAVEKEAREKLWLMKPDEKVIVTKGR
jgi:cell division protein FtsB